MLAGQKGCWWVERGPGVSKIGAGGSKMGPGESKRVLVS